MKNTQLKRFLIPIVLLLVILLPFAIPEKSSGDEELFAHDHVARQTSIQLIEQGVSIKRFVVDSGYNFEYPDAVRGIYVTGHSAGGSRFNSLVELVNNSDLNAMVIDIKEDHGYLTFKPDEDSPFVAIGQNYIKDIQEMMKTLEENQIYPIARVVVFKDSVLAENRPDLSFTENGSVWENNRGESFVNPFQKEVWEYNVDIAKMAAEMGFKEIQFDYVRFPEGFEHRDGDLTYSQGAYEDSEEDNVQRRVQAVTDFVAYAKQELEPYDIDVSVDIFGYAATIPEAPGIGQNFSKISENVDVISSMIYPSHWSNNYFGIPLPDAEPYRLTDEYAKVENEVLSKLENRPVSRPWIQDFEAPWIYNGTGIPVTKYGKKEVEAQIKALQDNGINEYLIWNAGNTYTQNVDYKP
ncbi:putative glycoside hydrolase [Ornithinibacillus massiliensis]|uniref:Glycoside hydrolase n=1 Tax=Ornithinibacillus massiliensis TaxID=1944633 RepID=A0ABS5MDP8_9BACI|nr:putative glycoside hydrolase [Ornithinibacillus massiliensis]MBS3680455.1 putative glycoside hydrolase [Ornithinibacillus massiliensis]